MFPGRVTRPEPLRGRGGLIWPFKGRVYSGLGISGAVVRLLVRVVSPLKDTPGRRARPLIGFVNRGWGYFFRYFAGLVSFCYGPRLFKALIYGRFVSPGENLAIIFLIF